MLNEALVRDMALPYIQCEIIAYIAPCQRILSLDETVWFWMAHHPAIFPLIHSKTGSLHIFKTEEEAIRILDEFLEGPERQVATYIGSLQIEVVSDTMANIIRQYEITLFSTLTKKRDYYINEEKAEAE